MLATLNDKFLPQYEISLQFKDILFKKKKKKIETPHKMDHATFTNLEKGLIAFYNQDFELALNYYRNVLDKYPYFGLAHQRIANSHYQLKQFYLAEKHWKLALKYNSPNKEKIMYFLSTIEELQLEETKLDMLTTINN